MLTCKTVLYLVCIHLRSLLVLILMLTVMITVDMILMIHVSKHVCKRKINSKS